MRVDNSVISGYGVGRSKYKNTVKQDFDTDISDMEISQKEAEEQISDLELTLKPKQPEDTNLLVQETSETIGLSDVLEAT